MSENDNVKYSLLARQAAEIEKLISSGVRLEAGTGYSLASILHAAESRMATIRIDEGRVELERKEEKTREAAAIAALVEREHRLDEKEKLQYAGFLEKDCFSRADLPALERFYGRSYAKLSDDGKLQMHERVQEGIRRGNFSFEELPSNMREAEEDLKPSLREPGKTKAQERKTSGESHQTEPSNLEGSVTKVKEPDVAAQAPSEPAKPEMPEGLAGLSKLSPVQETDAVIVPQIERGGESPTRGG